MTTLGLNPRARRRVRPGQREVDGHGANGHDRLPPYSPEAEQGVLGCVLESPMDSMVLCTAKLGEGGDAFYDLRHQTIYAALVEMFGRREAIDVITLQQRLKDKQLLEEIGGIPYLSSLQDAVPSAANLSYYLDIVLEKFLLRRMIQTCTDVVGRVYDCEGEVDELLDGAERDVLAVRARRSKRNRPGALELVGTAIERIEDKFNRKGAISGLSTGFPDLDMVTDGLCPGDLVVPAALPSIGKTSLCMNIVESVVLTGKFPAAVFSLEMTAEQLMVRMLCSTAMVNLHVVGRGTMTESDFPKLTAAAGRLSHCGLHIVDDMESVQEIVAEARRLKQEHDIKLVVVDYLQLVTGGARGRDANREQEVSGCAAAFKRAAKELRVPFLVPSQVTETAHGVQQLRESKAIGQHADGVWMLEEGEGGTVDAGPVSLWVRKNRNGPRNVRVELTFLKCFTRFESAAKVPEDGEETV